MPMPEPTEKEKLLQEEVGVLRRRLGQAVSRLDALGQSDLVDEITGRDRSVKEVLCGRTH